MAGIEAAAHVLHSLAFPLFFDNLQQKAAVLRQGL
jgi:hypothetical protein